MHAMVWMDLKIIRLSDRNQAKKEKKNSTIQYDSIYIKLEMMWTNDMSD